MSPKDGEALSGAEGELQRIMMGFNFNIKNIVWSPFNLWDIVLIDKAHRGWVLLSMERSVCGLVAIIYISAPLPLLLMSLQIT